jgi:hypothetical protein
MKMASALRFGDKLRGHEVLAGPAVAQCAQRPERGVQDGLVSQTSTHGSACSHIGYSISPAMVMNMVGKGSKYPFAYRDARTASSISSDAVLPAAHPRPGSRPRTSGRITMYDNSNASGLAEWPAIPVDRVAGQSRDERRRLGANSTSPRNSPKARKGVELAPYRAGQGMVRAFPSLQPDAGVLRRRLAAGRLRADRVILVGPGASTPSAPPRESSLRLPIASLPWRRSSSGPRMGDSISVTRPMFFNTQTSFR